MSEPVRRSREIEDFSKRYVIAPLIDFVVPILVKLKISPNMVSIIGMLCGVSAAIILSHYNDSWHYSLMGLGMLIVWHVFDGADGRVARITNTQSEFGKIVDGICDYIVFIAVYIVLGMAVTMVYGPWAWLLVLAAGMMHAVQAGAYELQRQEFEFWGRGKKSAELPDLENVPPLPEGSSLWARLATGLGIGYAKMQYSFSGIDGEIRPSLYAHVDTLSGEEPVQSFRDTYRKLCAAQVLKWAIMCPHYRSYIIVFACLMKAPEIYFIAEALVLPLFHIYLVKNQNGFNATLLARIKAEGEQ